MKPYILSFIRAAHSIDVVILDEKGEIQQLVFPKTMSDIEIKAAIFKEQIPQKQEEKAEPIKPVKVATVPEPPVVQKNRVTRSQMINALEQAGITDYNPNNRESLTAAYDKLTAK